MKKLPFYKIQVCMIVFFRTLIVLTFTCEHLLVARVQISIRSIETWHFYQNTVFTSAWSSRLCVFTCMCTVVCDVFLSLCMSFVSASSFPQSPLCPLIDNLTWTLTLFVFHTDTSTIDLLIFPVFYSQCWQKSTERKIRHLLWGLKLSVNRITFCQYLKFLFEHTSMCKNKLVSVKGERLKEVCLSLIFLLFGSIHAFS